MLKDLRVAWRFLGKRRISTTLAVVTLGITVATCTLAVGVLDEMFWRPLTSEHGERLVTVYHTRVSAPQFQVLSYPDYVGVRDRLQRDVDLAAFVRVFHTLGGNERPARVQGELVSGNYFAVLGAKPFVGRLLTPDDDLRPGPPIVVLGYDLWRRAFGSDPGAVGRLIRLNRNSYTVVGVAPRGFKAPAYPSELWMPLTMAQQSFGGLDVLSRADIPLFQTVARPQQTLTVAHVQGRVEGLPTSAGTDGWRLTVLPGQHLRFWPAYRTALGRFLGIFAALGACVLVIACANLAGLLLARRGERERELAVRQALGATAGHLFRRLLAESLILTVLGGTIGLLLAYGTATVVERIAVPVPVHVALTPNLRLMGISIAVSIVASLVFTTIFAWKGLGRDIHRALAASTPTMASGAGVQRALVVAQVAVSCVCLSAAGLLARTVLAVDRIDVGFDTANTVIGLVGPGDQGYTAATGAAFYERLQHDLEREPQVESVALEWNATLGAIRAVRRVSVGAHEPVDARYNVVGPGYFRTLTIPLVAGREFEPGDRQTSEPVAVVNESMAARIGGSVVGQSLSLANERAPRRVVGIVRDVKYNAITEPAQPFVYVPLAQAFRRDVWVHVRTKAANAEVLLRTTLRRLDPNVALSDVHTLAAQLDLARASPRMAARASGVMASIAVLLALVGVYGLLAASVDRRSRELSIRVALGATPQDIVRSVALEGLRVTAVGLCFGTLAALAGSGLLAALLYGVRPRDPLVLALVPVVILCVSIPAWLAPARRAAAADPMTILKST